MTTCYDYMQLLAAKVTDELVTTNIGGLAESWYSVKHRDGNLYGVYMSGATSIALGLAVCLPHRRVISLDGDGSSLMSLPILPAIAKQNVSNLVVIVFDNETYGRHGVPTFTADSTDLVKMAQGAGIQNASLITQPSEFQKAIDKAFQAKGPSFIVVKVEVHTRVPRTAIRAEDGRENKYRFIRYIEKTENIQVIKPIAME